ncbi:FtsX-like permease family protein [Lewinella sp. IMCC34191]|uniref:FtsX-like permease family protein n=1 Tax=Lewinella sp. IMCC34191 TaxID=2259172 RepID=UPI000E22700A|nr:FtsX-like permease family protein [Lewinella sp. IMCC34191]
MPHSPRKFDFEQALLDWRTLHLRSAALEPEQLDELESSLHDRYEENLIRGMAPEEAFAAARDRVSPDPAATGREFSKLNRLLPGNLRIAVRMLYRRWGYNLINFACLAAGIFTVALAVLYLNYETGYDRFVPDADRKYRVGRIYRSQGYSIVGFPRFFETTGEEQLRQLEGIRGFRGVRSATQFMTYPDPTYVTVERRKLPVADVLETNTPESFLDYFGWSFLQGNTESFAGQPNTALLTASLAERYFGADWRGASVLGRELTIDTIIYKIAGVLEDVPADAHFTFSLALHRDRIDYWGSRLYVEVEPTVDPEALSRRLNADIGRIDPSLAGDELFGGLVLQSLPSLHLGSDLLYEMKPPGDVRYLYIIGIIALVVLLLTISNYTNLAMAMNAGRGREIGMRKLFGARRGQVAGQFVLEAVVMSLLTVPVVLLALWLILPVFNALMDTAIAENAWSRPDLWSVILGIGVGVGLLASIYPALVLSGRQPLQLLRGNTAGRGGSKLTLRKGIVGLQFALLIGLCSATLIVNRQFRFLQEKNLGYTRDGVLYVNMDGDSTRFATFQREVSRLPGVEAVGADGYMGGQPYNQTTYNLDGTTEVYDDAYLVEMSTASAELLGLQTSIALVSDGPASRTLINETLAERLAARENLKPTELIGRMLITEPEYSDEETGQVGFPVTIAGTFADINMFSLRNRVDPMILTLRPSPRYVYWAAVRFEGAGTAEVRESVRGVYESLFPDRTFRARLLSGNLRELYRAEERISRLSIFFSLVAFGVAAIGLVALTAYLTTLKRREIGIRKILGASTLSLLRRFNGEYLPLLGVALVVAAPLTFLALSAWLAGFAYRTTVSPWLFLLAGLVTLVITVVAVSLTTLRAIRSVPAEVLRDNG